MPDPQPDECPSCGGTARRYAEHGTSTVHVTAEVTFRHYPRLAEAWWSDVTGDLAPGSRDARRRQIVFGGAFLETYLYEWVRDSVLVDASSGKWDRLDALFPLNDRRSVVVRWKETPRTLVQEGDIRRSPDLGGAVWQEVTDVLEFRNGLVHGTSSRPVGSGVPDEQISRASFDRLASLDPAWVPNVLCGVVDLLHAGTGTGSRPEWMLWPLPSLSSTEESS